MGAIGILDRIPPWSTTGIGSLPATEPAAAVEHAMRAYDVPFCPQLPRLEGDMIASALEVPVAWEPFVSALGDRPPPHGLVKIQSVGPATLGALRGDGGPASTAAAATDLARAIAPLRRRLSDLGLDVLLVLDEPAVESASTDGLVEAWREVTEGAPAWGLHFCCPVPWELVNRAGPELLSFDLIVNPVDAAASEAIERIDRAGGRIAWGAIPTLDREAPEISEERLLAAISSTSVSGGLLTASCGTGALTEGRELEIAGDLRELRERMLRGR